MSIVADEDLYEVAEIKDCSGRTVRWIKTCLHANTVPVEAAISGEIVAHLCVTCDTQLP